MRSIFRAKCEDFGNRESEKMFRRFSRHQSRKQLLKTFEMESSSLGPRAAAAVSSIISYHPECRVLRLSGNSFGDSGASSIATLLLQSRKLISLEIASCGISDSGARCIFEALQRNKTLVGLHAGSGSGVSRNALGPASVEALCATLRQNRVLSELNLSMTEITAESIEMIAAGLALNQALQILTLSHNNIQSRGTASLLNALLTSRVAELHLASNHLKDDVGPHFASFLAESRRLMHLDLSGNSLTQRFAQTIAIPLSTSDRHLASLNLSRNPLGNRGIAAIGPAMATNRSLMRLNVAACKFQPAGFAEFCHSLQKNATLQALILEHNALRDEGAAALADVVSEHPTLKELNVELCEIADAGAKALFEGLQASKSMRKVTIKNNLICDGICIQKAIAVNSQIYHLNVDYNDIPFKVFSEIQKQVAINLNMWKNRQEVKTEEEVEAMERAEADLQACREAIANERRLVQMKAEQAAALRAELQRLEDAKLARLTKLEQDVAAISQQADETHAQLRAETDKQGSVAATAATDLSQLQLRVAREIERFRGEVKSLSTTEKWIVEGKLANEQELEALTERRLEAKQKYQMAVQMLEARFQSAKMPKLEELGEVGDGEKKKKKEKAGAKPNGKGRRAPAKPVNQNSTG
jgi:Ran GTPase-activating protein (RanGAP) involved in mRNA processing and transport